MLTFSRCISRGRRQFTGNMTVFFLRRSQLPRADAGSLRVGLTVGKVLGDAVERNRIKRRMREAVRLSWPAEAASGGRGVQSPEVGFAVAVRRIARRGGTRSEAGNAAGAGSKAQEP